MVSHKSPDTSVSPCPSSVRNAMPVEFIGQSVSTARGWKMYEVGREKYINDNYYYIRQQCLRRNAVDDACNTFE